MLVSKVELVQLLVLLSDEWDIGFKLSIKLQ